MARCSTCEVTYEPEHEARRCGVCRSSAPAWLDAPDDRGYWYWRDADGDTGIDYVEISNGRPMVYRPGAKGLLNPWHNCQWQRVAPPRES